VSGGAALHLPAGDGRAWAAAMTSAIERREWLAGLREAGLRRAADFSWARTARRTRQVYDEARRRFGS
ncbi:MAG: glycosyltransferase family 4 protein, partial [Bryobacteraceae bacterium]